MTKWKKYIVGEWSWKRLLRTVAFTYLALLIIGLFFADLLIHHPPPSGDSYSEYDPNVSLVENSAGNRIATFYLPANSGMPTLLWSHGNAEDIGYLQEVFFSFHQRGYGILAYDYPGYGISEGKPNEKNCYDAAQTVWNHLTQKLKISPDQIIIFGQSVGSGPAVWLASHQKCAGLVMISPFTSAFRTATRFPLFPGDKFKNIDRIESINMPLLIIHGKKDEVIAQWHGRKLHELHPGPKTFIDVPESGHNDIFTLATNEILDALDAFCKKHTSPER